MLDTELGIVTLVSALQPENALWPILITDSGISSLKIDLQSLKALLGILFVPSGMLKTTAVSDDSRLKGASA